MSSRVSNNKNYNNKHEVIKMMEIEHSRYIKRINIEIVEELISELELDCREPKKMKKMNKILKKLLKEVRLQQ